MADLQWTDWSLVKTLSIIPASHAPATVLPENWSSAWFGAIGASFRVTERLLLQTGIGYDLSPVTNGNRTTRIPDADRALLGGGVTYSLLTNVNVQLAVLEVLSGTTKIDNSASPTAGIIRGTYNTQAPTVSLAMTARF
jgi:long-chain fatty acid transport protein